MGGNPAQVNLSGMTQRLDLSKADVDRVKSHLAKYYKKMDEARRGSAAELDRYRHRQVRQPTQRDVRLVLRLAVQPRIRETCRHRR
jgi:hypothetical protein